MSILDFRSDTVTHPTEEMRKAMYSAAVGDDVYGDDPTVNSLEEYAADLLGMESALFACSGTMGNLIALMSHCGRGDGVLMGVDSHTWKNEGGNIANVAGLMPYPLDDSNGVPTMESLKDSFQPDGNVHYAHTTLLVLENTHNSSGGIPISVDSFSAIAKEARNMGLLIHVDGARIFNATAYLGVGIKEYSAKIDSIQICLSKGLAAPMGSILCGKKDFIQRARKYRKIVGGGQRQVGIVAAAGLIALRDMRERLSVDHANAALLAELLADAGLDVEQVSARTNMVYFRLDENQCDADTLVARCQDRGLLIGAVASRRVRMVTHLGLDGQSVKDAVRIVKEVAVQ